MAPSSRSTALPSTARRSSRWPKSGRAGEETLNAKLAPLSTCSWPRKHLSGARSAEPDRRGLVGLATSGRALSNVRNKEVAHEKVQSCTGHPAAAADARGERANREGRQPGGRPEGGEDERGRVPH